MNEIYGIIGTLLGAITGWLLARLHIGKLHISLGSYSEEAHRRESLGGMSSTAHSGTLTHVALHFVIHLYNSFPVPRAIRECELVFFDVTGSEIFRTTVYDKDSGHVIAHSLHYDPIGIINLDGYKSEDINALVFLHDIDLMYKISKIEFHYKNAKRKRKKLKYKPIDFSSIPRTVEETNQGMR